MKKFMVVFSVLFVMGFGGFVLAVQSEGDKDMTESKEMMKDDGGTMKEEGKTMEKEGEMMKEEGKMMEIRPL